MLVEQVLLLIKGNGFHRKHDLIATTFILSFTVVLYLRLKQYSFQKKLQTLV